jgi:hypothetical protein
MLSHQNQRIDIAIVVTDMSLLDGNELNHLILLNNDKKYDNLQMIRCKLVKDHLRLFLDYME